MRGERSPDQQLLENRSFQGQEADGVTAAAWEPHGCSVVLWDRGLLEEPSCSGKEYLQEYLQQWICCLLAVKLLTGK